MTPLHHMHFHVLQRFVSAPLLSPVTQQQHEMGYWGAGPL